MSSVGVIRSTFEQGRHCERTDLEYGAYVTRHAGQNLLKLRIQGAKCGGCLSKIENAVLALTGVAVARLNLSNGQMRVRWDGALPANEIVGAILSLGFDVYPDIAEHADARKPNEEKSLLIAMGVAGFAAANIMLLSVSIWAGHGEMGEATRRALHAVSGAIALPVLVFSGRHFFQSAWAVLRRGHANMDVPISLALCLAFGVSVSETIRGGEHAYFDAAVMLLFFLLIGRFLEARLRRQAYSAANALAAMRNRPVCVVGADGSVKKIAADKVVVGDYVFLAPGERAVVDMRITQGNSDIDESLLSGESLPKHYGPGMILPAGAINLTASIQGKAINEADNSILATISDMLEAGEQRRSSYRKLADRAVAFYIPFVHSAAAFAAIAWLVFGASISEALMIAVATLIITCPCALALAAPAAQIVAASRLFKNGIYLRSGDALERIAEVDHITFDKTGTLTLGVPKLVSVVINGTPIRPDTLEARVFIDVAAVLARASRHPLSKAIVNEAGNGRVLTDIVEVPGRGLEAVVEDEMWRLGAASWVSDCQLPAVRGPAIYLRKGVGQTVGFLFEDTPLATAKQSINELKTLGLTVEVISGDQSASVQKIADTLDIEDWSAECTPTSKVDRLAQLRSTGVKTLMIGDGLNDAGALALAHASLAPGSAMDISQSASDAVYCGGLTNIPAIITVARRTRRIMRENFAFAAGYNCIAVPIAIAGYVTPLIAAVAMSLSSILVTLNALRLQGGDL